MDANDLWQVHFSGLASELLVGIFQYLLDNDEVVFAKELVQLIRQEGNARLKTLPYRGRVVPELESVTKQYREIRVKTYRLIYRPIEKQRTVRILLVAHVKQDIRELLVKALM